MKPWIIIAGLSLFLLATLAACNAPPGEPEAQLPTVSAFTWEPYSDPAGSYTMNIPDYLPLELVEVAEDGKSSLTRWSVWIDERSPFAVEVLAQYNGAGGGFSAEENSKHNFGNISGLYGKPVVVRHIEPPHPVQGGWAYTVEIELREENACTIRSTDYYDAKPGWTYFATTKICAYENITYEADGRTAIFSLTPTP